MTNENNKKIAVQIDLEKYGDLWEDFYDSLIAEQRKDEENVPWEDVKKALRKAGKLE